MKGLLIRLLTVALIGTAASNTFAQAPNLQAIHNAADPSLALLDVAVTLLGVPIVQIDSVAFRTALPTVAGIAGLPLVVSVSQSGGPEVLSFPITLVSGRTYLGAIQGVDNPAQFAPNPQGRNIALNIALTDQGRTSSSVPGQAQFIFMNGVTDAPAVDLALSGGAQLADNIGYGDISPYATVSAAPHILELTDQTGALLGFFDANFSGFADSALVLFLSGFMDPSQNQNGAPMAMFAATPSGNVVQFPLLLTGIGEGEGSPEKLTYRLAQNYPNPFNPSTTIEFSLPQRQHVQITIFNAVGQVVQTLVDGELPAGTHRLQWNARDFPSGAYFYRMNTEGFTRTRRLLLVK